ncbi:MAG TPA: cyclopropane fatty acyl phospholipid synthase [Candidatus Binatia bacterium]|nr:cyclopropane fatty acyl phospholipid synthase [Candidatus Binatia bacterium]
MLRTVPSAKETIRKLLAAADVQINGERAWDIRVRDEHFYQRVLAGGSLALGESYMDGWWETEALDQCIFRIVRAGLKKRVVPRLSTVIAYLKSTLLNLQSKNRARENVHRHYDQSAKLYLSFLDPYNQYTCGYFQSVDDLNRAQEQKLDLICKKLRITGADEVLDIGCGWGGFAKLASERYRCRVTGITISDQQFEYARNYTQGLPVTILKKDYRDLSGKFDKILICGMMEHVGFKNHRALMRVVHHSLRDDGLFLLQTIGARETSRFIDPWLGTYIFPNTLLPSIKQIAEAIEGLFVVEDWQNFGAFYDQTLLAWFRNFDANWEKLRAEFDERFYRMWKYYLLACAGLFRARETQLWQVVLSKNGLLGGYQPVR